MLVVSPLRDMNQVLIERNSEGGKVRRGLGDLDIIGVRLSLGSMMRKVGDKEIEEKRRDDWALRNTRVDDSKRWRSVAEETTGCPTPEVCSKLPHKIWLQIWLNNLLYEQGMVHTVESLRNINCYRWCPNRRLLLIEPIRHSCGQGEESSGAGLICLEAMLGGRAGKGSREIRKKETLKDLDRRRKKRDGTIGGAKGGGLVRFEDGDDVGTFPNYGEVSVRDRVVIEMGQILSSRLPQMFQVQGCESIRTRSGGVRGLTDGSISVLHGERSEAMFDFVQLVEPTLNYTSFLIWPVNPNRSVLLVEPPSNGRRFGESSVAETDGLIRGLKGFLTG
jgi:hypothetical protein